MDKFERLVNRKSNLTIKLVRSPSDHFGGFITGKTIYLNKNLSIQEQYQWLQEEIAHYDYTVGDIVDENTTDKRKQEHLARSKAMERTVTLDGLVYCFVHELWAPDEIADYFDVTDDYLRDCLENYATKRGSVFRYKDYYFDLRCGLNITKI
ncbi:hypothetical protein LOOC260_109490 [Paucilactobacillus hokkaidonensis JCM 18461]|uniref:Toxin n=2 Tax=Paucilactobacillus hokkaidonensis TaxID=1193095 RepID=A0A0A1GX25_9LACO|nr:hypothetical protein [Paucilactobacillus hokkaidonensis]KRO07357.1 hypothetical protein IV59_GL001877 [Paucilactobacillus hokkaidonensis]BAP85488.1 hypothetical protein LOOC260_109490 [Paucilactobacillus hokkaidonensis JCM 18461]